jgi:hypothetical protein
VGEKPAPSGAAFFDLYTDPCEESGKMLPTFPAKGMFNVRTVADAVRRRQIAGVGQGEQLAAREWPLEHDPEKWTPVFPRDKREAFARRSCSNKKIERDDD